MNSILGDFKYLLWITFGPEEKAMYFHLISMWTRFILMNPTMHYHLCLGHHIITRSTLIHRSKLILLRSATSIIASVFIHLGPKAPFFFSNSSSSACNSASIFAPFEGSLPWFLA